MSLAARDAAIATKDGAYGAVLYQIPRDGRVIHNQFGTGAPRLSALVRAASTAQDTSGEKDM